MRGSGLGAVLQTYVRQLCERHQLGLARLSVAPSNGRALAYYEKHGWQGIGPNPRQPHVWGMELAYPGIRTPCVRNGMV
jgi:GNAT superfamily N-acetyltransferase